MSEHNLATVIKFLKDDLGIPSDVIENSSEQDIVRYFQHRTKLGAQNWNNVLDYIKSGLGAPLNLLELSDDEIIQKLRDHVLSLFSQYSPAERYSYITSANRVGATRAGSPQWLYRIPVDPGTYITDILGAYPTKEVSIVDMYGGAIINARAAMELVISNTYIDAVRSLTVRNTWQFIPPDMMLFDQEVTSSVVVYCAPHDVLNTVRPDMYHKALKPLCLANVKLWLSALRSKFEGLTTPFGQLNLNWDKLQNEGVTERDNAIAILEALPPKILIEVS